MFQQQVNIHKAASPIPSPWLLASLPMKTLAISGWGYSFPSAFSLCLYVLHGQALGSAGPLDVAVWSLAPCVQHQSMVHQPGPLEDIIIYVNHNVFLRATKIQVTTKSSFTWSTQNQTAVDSSWGIIHFPSSYIVTIFLQTIHKQNLQLCTFY